MYGTYKFYSQKKYRENSRKQAQTGQTEANRPNRGKQAKRQKNFFFLIYFSQSDPGSLILENLVAGKNCWKAPLYIRVFDLDEVP